MNKTDMVTTIAEAEAQKFIVPDYDNWLEFTYLINGYAILEEMGEDWGEWFSRHNDNFYKDNKIEVSVLEARIWLFLESRAMRFGSGYEDYRLVDALLQHIASLSNQPYTPLTEADIQRRIQNQPPGMF